MTVEQLRDVLDKLPPIANVLVEGSTQDATFGHFDIWTATVERDVWSYDVPTDTYRCLPVAVILRPD